MSLLLEINNEAAETKLIAESIEHSLGELFEGFSPDSMQLICESAAEYLGKLAAELKMGHSLRDIDRSIDMVTALRAIGSSENREAFNIKLKTFNVLIQNAGKAANVDNALVKLSRNPSIATIRSEVEELLQASTIPDNTEQKQKALSLINKLRLGYERVQNTIASKFADNSAT